MPGKKNKKPQDSRGKEGPKKQDYKSPRLSVYGKLRDITMGEKGKVKIDSDPGGVGSTKR
jgi:hypothetical protein